MSIYRKIALLLLASVILIGSNFVIIPGVLRLDVQAFDPVASGSQDEPLTLPNYNIRPFYVFVFLLIHPFALGLGILAVKLMSNIFMPEKLILVRSSMDFLLNGIFFTSLIRSVFMLYVLFYAENTAARQEGIRLQGIAFQFTVMLVAASLLILFRVLFVYRIIPRPISLLGMILNLLALFTAFLTFNLNFPFALRASVGVILITSTCVMLASILLLYDRVLQQQEKTRVLERR